MDYFGTSSLLNWRKTPSGCKNESRAACELTYNYNYLFFIELVSVEKVVNKYGQFLLCSANGDEQKHENGSIFGCDFCEIHSLAPQSGRIGTR